MAKGVYIGVPPISNPGPFSSTSGWDANQNVAISVSNGALRVASQQSSSTPGTYTQLTSNIPANTSLTLTVTLRGNVGVMPCFYNSTVSATLNTSYQPLTSSYQTITLTGTTSAVTDRLYFFMTSPTTSSWFEIGSIQLTYGVARKVKKMYIGVGGVARKVKKGYIGVGGVARPFYSADMKPMYYGGVGNSGAYWFDSGGTMSTTKLQVGDYAALYAPYYCKDAYTPSWDKRVLRFWSPKFVASDLTISNARNGWSYTTNYIHSFTGNSGAIQHCHVNASLVESSHAMPATFAYSNGYYSHPNYVFLHGSPSNTSMVIKDDLTTATVAAPTLDWNSCLGSSSAGYLFVCGGYRSGNATSTVDVYNSSFVKGTSFGLPYSVRRGYSNEVAATKKCVYFTYSHSYQGAMIIRDNLTTSPVGASGQGRYDYHFGIDLGDYIMLLGYGQSGSNGTRAFELFNTNTMTYEIQENLPFSVGCTVSLTSSDSIAVLGGSFIGDEVYSYGSYGFKLN